MLSILNTLARAQAHTHTHTRDSMNAWLHSSSNLILKPYIWASNPPYSYNSLRWAHVFVSIINIYHTKMEQTKDRINISFAMHFISTHCQIENFLASVVVFCSTKVHDLPSEYVSVLRILYRFVCNVCICIQYILHELRHFDHIYHTHSHTRIWILLFYDEFTTCEFSHCNKNQIAWRIAH